MFSFWN